MKYSKKGSCKIIKFGFTFKIDNQGVWLCGARLLQINDDI